MPTIKQLIKRPRIPPKARSKVPALERSPQKGVFVQKFIQRLLKNQIRL